ncbi:hypothetical protein [Nocardioides hwasunensis]|uniref:Ig-like domain repeat protein n=1 Tax=Nocardioides hwasunensis TaxID=397258 RepID=A0ABR8MET2_9ACTN|nr:hypothetical protein [Nocardioides hwasunensis]MBD3913581.1 hypothetical protein [Nocardioides hwasunensis]
MKKPVSLLMSALALALVPTGATASQPTGSMTARTGAGSFTVAPTLTLPAEDCVDHYYDLHLTIGEDTDDWYVDVTVLAPDGSIVGGYESDTYNDTGAQLLDDYVTLCSGDDDPGAYRIVGDLYTTNDDSPTYVKQALTPSGFTVVAAPVTYVDVAGTVSKKLVRRGVELTFKADKVPASTTVRTPLRWSVVVDGRLTSFTQKPGATKRKKYVFAQGSGRHRIKVLRNGKPTLKVVVRS